MAHSSFQQPFAEQSSALPFLSLSILGLSTATPACAWPQDVAAEFAKTMLLEGDPIARLLPALYRRAGVKKRHSVLLEANAREGDLPTQSFYAPATASDPRGPTTGARMRAFAEHAPGLACVAARRALAASEISAEEITHLITVSCTGFAAPGVELELAIQLGLRADVQRTHVGYMGCHGALNALRVAQAFAAAEPGARVLVVAVELCSLHFHYGNDPEQMVANALFADGAAALVACAAGRGTDGLHGPDGHDAWRMIAQGSCFVPNSADAMTWRIGDHGFEMTLAARVPDLIESALRPWLEAWLAEHDLTIGAVGSWGVHPGGPRILNAVQKTLGLAADALAASRGVLENYGNMSSPTLLFILDELARAQAPRPCVALGFGPGLAIEAALFV